MTATGNLSLRLSPLGNHPVSLLYHGDCLLIGLRMFAIANAEDLNNRLISLMRTVMRTVV